MHEQYDEYDEPNKGKTAVCGSPTFFLAGM